MDSGLDWSFLRQIKSRCGPPGFAHGFLTLSNEAECLYKITDYWDSVSEECLLWNDPTLNIQWPDLGMSLILSAKDLQGLSWTEAPKYL